MSEKTGGSENAQQKSGTIAMLMKKHLHQITDTLKLFITAHCKTEGISQFSLNLYFHL